MNEKQEKDVIRNAKAKNDDAVIIANDNDIDVDNDDVDVEVKKPAPTLAADKNSYNKSKYNNNSNNNKSNNKRKKRKRSKSEDIQELHEIQLERYDRLLFTSNKQIHKQVKLVKTFLLQKEIRSNNNAKENNKVNSLKSLDLNVVTQQAIRQLGLYHCDPRYKMTTTIVATETETTRPVDGDDNDNNEDDEADKEDDRNDEDAVGNDNDDDDVVAIKKAEKEDDKIENDNKKKNRNNKRAKKMKNDNTASPTKIPSPLNINNPQKVYVDLILTHKRFSKVLEEWNIKVTEYRRWCMKLEQRNYSNPYSGEDDIIVSSSKRAKKNKNKNLVKKEREQTKLQQTQNSLQATVENVQSSLFCTLGGSGGDNGGDNNGEEEEEDDEGVEGVIGGGKYSSYGPAGAEDFQPIKLARKNRQGQRQRRAKAQAIQAKKEGRRNKKDNHVFHNSIGSSLNWREPKVKMDTENERFNSNSNERQQERGYSRGRGKELKRNTFNGNSNNGGGGHSQQYDDTNSKGGGYNDNNGQQQHQQKTSSAARSAAAAVVVADHPSWAAKQAQTTGIVAFQGKKITF
ncbi:hypothetical protein FRACYDRAFT_233716 [Fragilariopsis cylindrus CCMP1102]|uniref:Bud22 domain-containing protein n=1 Tax=Fragilariopsis cylindrus CCMP1102 TaxID=635003 RepID=A0A1E7FZF5_9STRA|nr:hypothetical protein FRACYDRAFT_233716 [Fragilariopsis cylindrus CCMP1102]|eukprot:OEU23542.1 hypothetical protein FRACYDRAFT_233716 [Fragilariopsis cylindrus CCMP1102]